MGMMFTLIFVLTIPMDVNKFINMLKKKAIYLELPT